MVLMVKKPPAVQEAQVQPLGREDPLQEGVATLSRISRTEEPGRLQSIGSESQTRLNRISVHARKLSRTVQLYTVIVFSFYSICILTF